MARERICVDPGPGFGKTASQTMELMRNFHELNRLGYPTMCAVSRKSYIGSAYGIDNPADRDQASAQEALAACELGASVVRAHNVEATAAALKDLRPYVLIGLGSNVALVANPGEETEGKIANLQQAITGLCTIPDTQIIDISSYYVMYVVDAEELTLPHPRVCERDFVVRPLLELLPHHVLADGTPVTEESVAFGKATKL